MRVRVRRSLAAGSGGWLLYPVVAVMAAAAVGGGAVVPRQPTFARSMAHAAGAIPRGSISWSRL